MPIMRKACYSCASPHVFAAHDGEVACRLRRNGAGTGEATSGLVVRLVDEGIRMAEHPGVVFRDGPTGRRAGLAAGPTCGRSSPCCATALTEWSDCGSEKLVDECVAQPSGMSC